MLNRIELIGGTIAIAVIAACVVAEVHKGKPDTPPIVTEQTREPTREQVTPPPVINEDPPVNHGQSATLGINAGALPDPSLTPGVVRPEATKEVLCDKAFRTGTVRNVPGSLKEAVRRRYGMTSARDKWCNTEQKCEIDHLVPLLLGGANDIENLFPQTYEGEWNAHHKDQLEVKMKKLVCSGKVELAFAQAVFKTNWIEGYRSYVNPTPLVAHRGYDDDAE